MDIDEYLWRNKLIAKEIAEKLGITTATLTHYKHRRKSPTLLTAIKLYLLTDGEIDFAHMISDKDEKELAKFLEETGKECQK